MATCVHAGGHKIFIDPGVALGPKRYGLFPHQLELLMKEHLWRKVEERVKEAEYVVITHYHHDHYNPEAYHIFKDKVVFIKDPERFINKSQRERASLLLDGIRGLAKEIVVADGKSFDLGGVRLSFSEPVPHGYTDRLGYVLQVLVEEDFRFLFTSDVQGFPLDAHKDFVIDARPDVIFADGPATYLFPKRFSKSAYEASFANMAELLERVRPSFFIVDHHATRDIKYTERFGELSSLSKNLGVLLCTAAHYMGKENLFLEAWRKKLYGNEIGLSPEQVQQI